MSVRDLKSFKVALLEKWIWRMRTKSKGKWKDIIESKFGGWRFLEERNGSKESRWRRDIKLIESISLGNWF